jgi:DNA-binding response OmpR family regulator
MNSGFILYIEDSEAQRKSLKLALELRGFKVEVAGDVATARSMFEKHRGRIDVVVLDMRLEDPEWPQMTGADVAMEYFNPRTPYPPEFLIHSAYSEVDYYKLALKLGVATYLEKSEYKQADIIRHIRALAIRRALSVKNPEASDRIQKIVETSRDQSEAIEKFCRNELEPNFSERLGTPFIFLLSVGDRTSCYTSEAGLPECLDLYTVIQTMIFSDIRSEAPFVLDAGQMPASLASSEKEVLHRLNGAAFIRLTITGDTRLSIGLLNADPDSKRLAEPPIEMASVLAEHLESPVIELFLSVLTKWTAFHAKIETRRKESMRTTAEICLSVERDLSLRLQRLMHSFPALSENRDFERLKKMAADLQATGNMLESLSRGGAANELSQQAIAEAPLNGFIKSVWTDINNGTAQDALSIYGDCNVRATPEDLSVVVSSILQWLAQRFIDTPPGIEPHISVRCGYYDNGVEAIFEDRSERLSKVLRERLFYPFAEIDGLDGVRKSYPSLYVAKVLIEERYTGVLEDISDADAAVADDPTAGGGHKFRVRFPSPSPAKVNNAYSV